MALQQVVDAAQEADDDLAAQIAETKKAVREDGLVSGVGFTNCCQNCLTLFSRNYRLYITTITYI